MSLTAMRRVLLIFAVAAHRGQGSPGIRALVKARVTAVDSALGRITLAIGGATVEAEFPPAPLADVKPGDDAAIDWRISPSALST